MHIAVKTLFSTFLSFALTQSSFSQPPGDNCGSPQSLTPGLSCSVTNSTLYQATVGTPVSSCGNTYDVWYSMVVPANAISVNIDVAATGNSLSSSNTFFAIYSGSACTPTLVPGTACTAAGTSLALTTLTASATYYVRVFTTIATTGSGTNSTKYAFTICARYTPPPANDDCSGAVTIISGTSCSASSGTLVNATPSSGISLGCEGAGTYYDIWYKFVAASNTQTLTVAGLESSVTNPEIQLYSGTCGALTSITCGTTELTSSSLTIGTNYYIRVSNVGSSLSSSGGFTICVTHPTPPVTVTPGRTNEVFQQTILSGSNALSYPWEITYGPDDKLWITEARGYKVHRMDPSTGTKTTVLDLNSTSTDLSAWGADSLRAVSLTSTTNWNASVNNWPQGGLAGLAIHPNFGKGTSQDFVYISYVHRYLYTAASSGGIFFRNKIVRFIYNSGTGKLGSPAVLCDTLPGGQDHNSQRMIIAPVTPGGTNYLFYASGDMGGGQYANRYRPLKAQEINSYEGKILRFNLEPDSDGSTSVPDAWIPDTNPYNSLLGVQSAVYSTGIRNNQGLAYDTSLNILYGSSHGAFSDDEINIIEPARNYGHPLVIGFGDGNYNGITAGSAPGMGGSAGSAPLITNEAAAAAAIGSSYKNPLFSAYTTPTPVSPSNYTTVNQLWNGTTGATNIWPSEAWSGLDIYAHTLIPGWKRSLIASGLKWGRLIRLKLGATGTTTLPSNSSFGNTGDTLTYFQSTNRYRDLSFAPNGKDVFIIMDNSSATSGPGVGNSIVPGCAGCVIKYSFLGYADNGGKSSISNSIDITAASANTITNATTVTIDASNNNLWVPITGPDGNIMAEIKANGNNLGTVTSKFYTHSGTTREDASKKLYLNRSITITPQNQPSSTVNVRLYVTNSELSSLISATNSNGASSSVNSIGDIKILKNNDASPEALTAAIAILDPVYAEAHAGTSNGGYVLQADITSFSSFYFGDPDMIPLPLELISFNGKIKENQALLQWETSNEDNTSHFEVERSTDAKLFEKTGLVSASGNSVNSKYSYTDKDADKQGAPLLYYRLKIVDKDGKISYSQVISLTISSASIPVVIYPNPVSDALNFRITMPQSSHVLLQVTDMQGRVMYKQNKFLRTGTEEIIINTKSWPAQSYSVIVTDNRKKVLISKKIIKM